MLREMEQIPGLSWIRLLYAYPTGIDDDLIQTIAESGKVVRYLDIPIQHASDRVLKAMRRPDTRDALCRLVERLRTAMSDIVLRTTVIVGFPGETQGDFDELLEFIRGARFDALGAFTYFPEAGTAGGRDAGPGPRRDQAGPVRRIDAGAAGDRVREEQGPHRQQTHLSRGLAGANILLAAKVDEPGPQAGDVSTDRLRISIASASSRTVRRSRDNSWL